jgi:hypothetical protein
MTVREELMSELAAAPDEVVLAVLTFLRSGPSAPSTTPAQVESSLINSTLGNQPSFFDLAQDLIGAGAGPGDLSTNPAYLQGYGK